jgi:taurine dioxygenase
MGQSRTRFRCKDRLKKPIHMQAGAIGAEVSDVDLAAPLSSSLVAEIRCAFLQHQVVFF